MLSCYAGLAFIKDSPCLREWTAATGHASELEMHIAASAEDKFEGRPTCRLSKRPHAWLISSPSTLVPQTPFARSPRSFYGVIISTVPTAVWHGHFERLGTMCAGVLMHQRCNSWRLPDPSLRAEQSDERESL